MCFDVLSAKFKSRKCTGEPRGLARTARERSSAVGKSRHYLEPGRRWCVSSHIAFIRGAAFAVELVVGAAASPNSALILGDDSPTFGANRRLAIRKRDRGAAWADLAAAAAATRFPMLCGPCGRRFSPILPSGHAIPRCLLGGWCDARAAVVTPVTVRSGSGAEHLGRPERACKLERETNHVLAAELRFLLGRTTARSRAIFRSRSAPSEAATARPNGNKHQMAAGSKTRRAQLAGSAFAASYGQARPLRNPSDDCYGLFRSYVFFTHARLEC